MKTLLFCIAVFLVASRPAAADTSAPPPNVLFIIVDDLNDYLGAYESYPAAYTPHMDALASESIVFTNAHSNGAWCAPSRVSMLNGFYPHTTNTYRGQTIRQNPVFRDVKNTFQHFKEHGYETYGTGKIFHNNHEEDSVWTRFGTRTDYGPWPVKDGAVISHPNVPARYRELVNNSPFLSLAPIGKPQHFDGWYYSEHPWNPDDTVRYQYQEEKSRNLLPDEKSAAFAVDVLGQKHKNPFLLTVGLVRPHTPYYVPREYYDRFPLESIVLPEVMTDDLADVASDLEFREGTTAYYRQLSQILRGYGGKVGWKKFMQGYLASIAFADDQIVKVLQALQESDYADNTIVVLTSDHGYHTGQKNRWFKQTLWERSTRVPLLIKVPGYSAEKCTKPVSLIDIYPTLNDLAGLPEQPNGPHGVRIEGHSLRPFLQNPASAEWEGPDVALTSTSLDTFYERHYSVRSEHYRYILTHSGQEELYDLRADPHEWYNRADDTHYAEIKENLKSQMRQLINFK